MCDLTKFYKYNPRSRNVGLFSEHTLSLLSKLKIPPDIIKFLQDEGLTTYCDDFFYTTLPQDHYQTFSEWGLNGKDCFAFLKTAFGSLCFYKKGKIFQLDPISGYLYKGRFQFCEFMNLLVTMDSFMESCYFDIYQKIEKKQTLANDEMYALVPALPLGGSFETSRIEIVKMQEQHSFLAQLFGNKTKIM